MHESIYIPEEDSFLMSGYLKRYFSGIKDKVNLLFLEVGCGSGINLQSASESGIEKRNIFCCDVNKEAVKHCREIGFENCVESNLFENLLDRKFDLILFNPPYLPENKLEPEDSKIATTGGKKGNEIILKFLKQAKKFLKTEGKIFLITSSLAGKIDFEKLGYEFKLVDEKKLFFEKLFLWELLFD